MYGAKTDFTYSFTAFKRLGIAVTATTILPIAYTREMYKMVLQKESFSFKIRITKITIDNILF